MQGVKEFLGLAEEKPKTAAEEFEDALCSICPQLTYQQRIGGYIACFFVSFCLSIGSFTRLVELVKGNPAPFVVFYTLGNVMAIIGSLFLSGPRAQCKKMWDPTRRIATSVYLLTIFFTIFVAFYEGIPDDGRIGIIIMCIFIQWIAMLWYTISFIPYARDYVIMICCQGPKDACNRCFGRK
uniref:Vesicle transport protein n=1 Tax=Aureoumbra lagunensis TaxID=44058 RepID=A0A7S3JV88_9STRA|mmetsp:Transcript_15808/g.20792  ORF Transcript_15808/g.20792 Transcript_15808/m.20792 type:complete len:182 (-) Transcript_15808:1436-1981(-)